MIRNKSLARIRIYAAPDGRFYYRGETRRGVPVAECASPPGGYASPRYARQRVRSDWPGVEVVDETMSSQSAQANATRIRNALIIAANRLRRESTG